MQELSWPWHIVHSSGHSVWSGSDPVQGKEALAYFLKHPGTYIKPRLVKLGIVDDDPVIETKTEIVRYSFVYGFRDDKAWLASGLFHDRSECEKSRQSILSAGVSKASDIVETKYVVTTTEKVNK